MGGTPEFKWADNVVKCELARQRAGKDASEKQVFDEYVKLAGRVVNGGYEEESEEKEEKPKKKKK